ncbi:hypothetical protein Sste5346_002563 [Sporothrix stenoceras]|uniref:Uncharacterized protein n=1 Tax=Sporothrix stenoceras TaxID=5173 RepID=A0ABR3ZJ63_9PEZI
MASNGLPVVPPTSPADITAPSLSYYDATRAVGTFLYALTVGVFSTTIQAGGYLVRGLVWLFGAVVSAATWPLVQLFKLLQFLLSPVTYTLSYVVAPFFAFLNFLSRLRPLYTYLGSAAFIGIVTGLVLKFASSYFFVVLRLDESAEAGAEWEEDEDYEEGADRASSQISQSPPKSRPARQLGEKARETLSLPKKEDITEPTVVVKTEDSITPKDEVWQWLEEYNPSQPVVALETHGEGGDTSASLLRKQSPGPGGLLSLTIMEESSSE